MHPRYFKEKSCDANLIGLVSTRVPSQAIVCANCKVQLQSGAIVQQSGFI